ncbi:beta-1,6-N-acetylglucosaminyltransferase [Rubellimicrobium rubrum]|uniref:Peptide O-xylosyltransferase n=1 Tax=Rubellimicrobium rubrum TaxID=2585369 RepID=A0A5C4MHU9_9RHOB|nr:beta-1,6-N-acetylglucosaminyltransferase [Rubellimicrobium rubrum]TNC44206.1 beta-1,6-N-acetylglucosaminyltransferase [Rubellimicrobium rubrum]
MKIAFVILAHERPQHVMELCEVLVASTTDAVAFIHYDLRSPDADYETLKAAVAQNERIRLVHARVAGRWGSFGLIEAPLNALAQVEAEGLEPDYVMLLSGSCLPCRPLAQLERYLEQNAGREFIEAEDESWVGNGWRSERWRYRFWFDHKTQHTAEWAFLQMQRLLRLKRRFPEGLEPRFGSQWWTLTWRTCRAILADVRAKPDRLRFFRSVWIPDEMFFQTYARKLAGPDRITGFGLTHFQFTNRGKPVVYHDDHIGYVGTLPRFFVRKAGPRAEALRRHCFSLAALPDDGAPLQEIGERRYDYQLTVEAQTHYPTPGQLFYRSQYVDTTDPVLSSIRAPYVVLVGPPVLTRAVADRIGGTLSNQFTIFGEVFAPDRVDLGPGRASIGGLHRDDVAIRNAHPALFLVRLRSRTTACPVITWSPFHHASLLEAVLRDPQALIVACLPFTEEEGQDRRLLHLASHPDRLTIPISPGLLPEYSPQLIRKLLFDILGEPRGNWPHWLGSLLSYREQPTAPWARDRIIAMPWSWGEEQSASELHRELFSRSLAACRFRTRPWFAALQSVLQNVAQGKEMERRINELLADFAICDESAASTQKHQLVIGAGAAPVGGEQVAV